MSEATICIIILLLSSCFLEQFHSSGILFFYTGNEGAIEGFLENSGSVFEFAKDVGALVVFAEHVSCLQDSFIVPCNN